MRAYQEYADKLKDEEREPGPETQKLYGQIQQGQVPGIEKRYKPVLMIHHEIPYALSPGSIPFVGREVEYAQLRKYLERARHGQGGCVLISGEAGVGKTRLIQELNTHARQHFQAQILQGRGHELGLQLSYQPWAEIVRESLHQLAGENLQTIPPLWLSEVAKLVPELRTRVPGLSENPPLPPQQEQLRFFEGLAQFFLALATVEAKHASPLLLFLDDLHWADEASLDLLKYFLSRIETKPILIFGTYRSEEVNEEHPLLKLTQSTEVRNFVHVLSLPRLGAAEIAELLGRLPLQVKRPEVFCGRLYKETGGNPLFLIATLQHFFEEGALRVEQQAWVTDIEDISMNYKELMVPPSVKELIARRVSRLREPERQLLSLVSVIGRDVELSLLERAWEGDVDCSTMLLGLAKAQLVMEREGQYKFTHDKVREVVYEEMSQLRRQILHQRVLRALEQLYASRLEEWAGLLAQHAYRAGEWKKTLEYALRALKKAVKEYRYKEGIELAAIGLKAAQNLEEAEADHNFVNTQRFEVLAQRSVIYHLQAKRAEQEQDLMQMHELAERLEEKSKLALSFYARGEFCLRTGRYPEAEEVRWKALELYRQIGDRQGEANSLSGIGNAYWHQGQHEEAIGYFRQALEIAQEIGDYRGQAVNLSNTGLIYWSLGKYGEALQYYHQSLKHHQALRDRQGEAITLDNIGIAHADLGSYDEAKKYYQQASEIFQEIGERYGRARNLNNLGSLYAELQENDKALRCFQQAAKIHREIRNRWSQGVSLINIGSTYSDLGQPKAALEHYAQARAIFEDLARQDAQLECLSLEANAYLELKQTKEALDCSSQAIQLLKSVQTCENPQQIYFNHSKVLSALDSETEAFAHLQKAYDEVIQRAEQIQDPKARASFLKNVKINREIVEAWERHQR